MGCNEFRWGDQTSKMYQQIVGAPWPVLHFYGSKGMFCYVASIRYLTSAQWSQLHSRCPAYYSSFQFAVASTVSPIDVPHMFCVWDLFCASTGDSILYYHLRYLRMCLRKDMKIHHVHDVQIMSQCPIGIPVCVNTTTCWTCFLIYYHEFSHGYHLFFLNVFTFRLLYSLQKLPLIFARWLRGPQSDAGKRLGGQCIWVPQEFWPTYRECYIF